MPGGKGFRSKAQKGTAERWADETRNIRGLSERVGGKRKYGPHVRNTRLTSIRKAGRQAQRMHARRSGFRGL